VWFSNALAERFGRPSGSRLSVRSTWRAATNYRVQALRLSGGLLVRHDGSTPPSTPAVCFALPAPYALSSACSLHCPCTRGMGLSDLCFSSAYGPCTTADAVCLLNPLAGLIHRPLPAGGCRSEQSGARATLSLRRPLVPAARVAIRWAALARSRLRLARRPREGPRHSAQCASAVPRHTRRGSSAGQ